MKLTLPARLGEGVTQIFAEKVPGAKAQNALQTSMERLLLHWRLC